MNIYMFRAECESDTFKIFKYFLKNNIVKIDDFDLVDDGVEFKSHKSIGEIREELKKSKIPDLHVVEDTLELKDNYTGIRKYRN